MIGARRTALAVVFLSVLSGGAGGAWWWLESRRFESTDNAYLREDAAIVAPRIEGYVREIVARENQRVAKGAPLVFLDDRNRSARVAQASAARDAKRAQAEGDRAAVGALEAQVSQQSSIVARTKAGLAVAEAEADRASLDYERYTILIATNATSAQKLELATSDHRKAKAELDRARASVTAEELRLPILESERLKAEARLRQSEADLAEAEAMLALAAIELEETVVRAPVSGVVGNLAARAGQFVRPGSALLTVVPQEPYVVANFKETQLANMHVGQQATIKVDAYPGLVLKGVVESFAPATGAQFSILPPENASGNFTKIVQRVPVRIRILDPEPVAEQLSSGLSVIVSVHTADDPCGGAPSCSPGRGSVLR
jgi:membrane fusion protein (multidrug efflux system)